MLGIRKMNLMETCERFVKPACVLSVILIIAMVITYGSEAYMGLMLCFRVTSLGALFGLMGTAQRGLSLCNTVANAPCSQQGQSPLCAWGAEASYFVYLSHYVLFLGFIDTMFFGLFGHSTVSLCAHYLICPLIKATILVAVYWIYRVIRSKTIGR
jgi:peptidoglycan/LPS O-acetylase OafA/YrhL